MVNLKCGFKGQHELWPIRMVRSEDQGIAMLVRKTRARVPVTMRTGEH